MEHIIKKQYQFFNSVVGEKWGRLTFTGRTYFKKDSGGKSRRFVEAECDCGTIRGYIWQKVKSGETRSCGCLRKDITSARMLTHGLSKTLLYMVWAEMKQRCFNPKNPGFENYGGRGIEVCDEWCDDYIVFKTWAENNGYAEGLEIDRRDNDKNYEPENCRFVPRPINMQNRRVTRMYTAFGETKCLFDWGKDPRCAVGMWTLRSRIDQQNWKSFKKALTTPKVDMLKAAREKKGNRYLTAFGEKKCFSAWLEDPRCTVKIDSLRDRLAKGWTHEKAISFPRRKVNLIT